MVRKKKVFKRVAVCCASVLFLFLALLPVVVPPADALPALPGGSASDPVIPAVGHLLVPLDRFSNNTYNISLENPFYSVALGSNYSEGFSSSIDVKLYNAVNFADPVWEFWNLGLESLSDGTYRAAYGVEMIASSNSVNFSMSNSSQFIISVTDLNKFLGGVLYNVPAFYQYKGTVSVSGSYPHFVTNGNIQGYWDLAPFSVVFEKTLRNTTSESNFTPALPLIPVEAFSNGLGNDDLIIIDEIVITFDLFCPLSDLVSDINPDGGPYAGYQSFAMPVSSTGFSYSFADFWSKYPYETTFVSDEPGGSNFDLSAFLRKGIGGFFQTEIIPGLSFGLMLSVSISVSMVLIFLKKLGG